MCTSNTYGSAATGAGLELYSYTQFMIVTNIQQRDFLLATARGLIVVKQQQQCILVLAGTRIYIFFFSGTKLWY